MMIKRYLPFRISREGYVPNRLHLKFVTGDGDFWEKKLSEQKKTVHYHLAKDGTVTAFSPLSSATTFLGPLQTSLAEREKVSEARRGILILVESDEKNCTEEQAEPLIRLLKGIQKEIFRLYAEPFELSRDRIFCDGEICLEELLELSYLGIPEQTLFRVKTGNYRTRTDAEDSVQRLQRAGIAAYIEEVRCG